MVSRLKQRQINATRKLGHRNFTAVDLTLRPSRRLLKFIARCGTLSQASKRFGMSLTSLQRFVEHTGGISGNSVAQILEQSGLTYEQAFVHQKA